MDIKKIKRIHIAAAVFLLAALVAGRVYIKSQDKPHGTGVTITETIVT